MKKLFIATLAAALVTGAVAETAEVYVNIPGERPVHCLNADVSWYGNIVEVRTPWGVTYRTGFANVVIVYRNYNNK